MRRFTHGLGKALRETGQAIDRLGLMVGNKNSFLENFARNRPIMNLFDKVGFFFTFEIAHLHSRGGMPEFSGVSSLSSPECEVDLLTLTRPSVL